MKKNKNDFGEEKKHSFSKGDTLPLETETELLLKKMERMQKKKNNYKNIDELENIYDTEPSKGKGGFFTGISDFLHNMNKIKQELNSFNFEGFDHEGMGEDDHEGMGEDDHEGMGEDEHEGMGEDDHEGMGDTEGFNDNIYSKHYQNKPKKNKKNPKLTITSRTPTRQPSSIPSTTSSTSTTSTTSSTSSKSKKNKSWEKFKKLIQAIFQNPKQFIYKYIAKPLYNIIYSGKKNNKDIDTITNQIILFIYSCIIIHISGNWYYLMFYKGPNYQRVKSQDFYDFLEKVGSSSSLIKKLRLDAQLKPVNVLNEFLCEIFGQIVPKIHDYLIYPVYITLSFLLNYESTFKRLFEYGCTLYNSAISNVKFLFILFTLFIFYCIMKYSSRVYQEYLAYTNVKSKKLPESSSNILNFIVVFELLFGIASFMTIISGTTGVKREQDKFSSKVKTTVRSISTILFAIAAPILYLLFFIIGLTFNVMILRIAGLFCVIYLYVYSYFGAYIRNNGERNKLNEMFRNLGDKDPCASTYDTPWLNYVISFIYDNLTSIIVAFTCAWSMIVYSKPKRITNRRAAQMLIVMNGLIIAMLVILYFIRNYIYKKMDLRDYNYIEPYNK